MSKRSEVWNYFNRNEKNKDYAFCKQCSKQIGCKGSSTTPLLNHLKLHKVQLNTSTTLKLSNEQNNPSSSKKIKYTLADNSITKFFKNKTLDEILARCVAEDGFSMNSIVKSHAIKEYVKSKGFDMPKSPTSVTKCILNFYEIKKKETINIIDEFKKKNTKFSITVDEWTDNSTNRFLNVSLHVLSDNFMKKFEVYVLGLIHIDGTCNAEQTKLYIENKLQEFGINIKRDIISSTHDAAAVMVKYGRIMGIISQLCYNHGLHLAITDVLYKKQRTNSEENQEIIDYEEIDDEEIEIKLVENVDSLMKINSFGDVNICEEDETNEVLEFTDDFQEVITKLRKIIRMFKSSSVKNNILQDYVNQQEGKKLQLMLDMKIRWNSLITMLKRFLQIKDPVNKALSELGQPKISKNNISMLKELLDVLSPLEAAVKELSKNSATLLTAEGVYKFIFDKLNEFESEFSKNLSKELKKRMDERRDKSLMTLLIFLETGSIPQSNKYFDYVSKAIAVAFAVEIFERIHPTTEESNSSRYEEIQEVIEETTCRSDDDGSQNNTQNIGKSLLQQQLEVAISSITHVEDNNKATTLLKKDFMILTNTKIRTEKLNILFNALLSIKPTSTATERVFSTAGLTKTKIRTRLNHETLNAIIFLKYTFLKMN